MGRAAEREALDRLLENVRMLEAAHLTLQAGAFDAALGLPALEPLDARLARDTYLDARSAALFAVRVFTKLGISSRRCLRDALPAPGGDAAPAYAPGV